MVLANFKKLFLAALAAAFTFSAQAQLTSVGSERASHRWKAAVTQDYRVIYPEGLDSLSLVYARNLQQFRPVVGLSAGFLPNQQYRTPMPVVLHPFSSVSNGFVTEAPRRMEFYTLPDPYSTLPPIPWETLLSIHENRHAAQVQFARSGFWTGFYYPFGEMAQLLVQGMYANLALLEGDAVVAETALSGSGRGRSADFLSYYRMAFDQGDWRNWYRWRYGSMKYYTPDYYRVGYLTVAGMRYLYDDPMFMAGYLQRLTKPWGVAALHKSVRSSSGKKFNEAWKEITASFHELWAADDSLRGPFPEWEAATDIPAVFTAYSGAVEVGEGRVWAVRSAMDRPAELVEVDEDGVIRTLRPFGGTSKLVCSPERGLVYWSEAIASPRWEFEGESRIYKMRTDASTAPEALTRGTRYFNPDVSADGLRLVVTEFPVEGGSAVVLLDAVSGKPSARISAPDGVCFTEPVFWGKDVVVAGVSNGGSALYRTDFKTLEPLLEPRPVSVKGLRSNAAGVYFTSDRTGTSEIYLFQPDTKELHRLSNTRYGVGEALLVGGKLAYTALTPEGKLLVRPDEKFDEKADFAVVAAHPVADRLTEQENRLIADAGIQPAPAETRVQPYKPLANLFHFHSWVPLYVDIDRFSATNSDFLYEKSTLGATGFFQNLTGTLAGTVGVSLHMDPFDQNRIAGGFHTRLVYRGLFPVINVRLDIGDRASALLQHRYSIDEDKAFLDVLPGIPELLPRPSLYMGGAITASVPLKFNSLGWNRTLNPYLTLGGSTDIRSQITEEVTYDKLLDTYYPTENNPVRLYSGIGYMELGASGSITQNTAPAQVMPRWGIGAEVKARASAEASLLYGKGYLYLPGITRSQGLKATGALQLRKLGIPGCFPLFDIGGADMAPRGLSETAVPYLLSRLGYAVAKASVDYAIPIPTDFSLTPYIYLRNLEIVPFADATVFLSETSFGVRRRRQYLYSAGVDLGMRFEKLLMISNSVKMGLRLAYNGGGCFDWIRENGSAKPFYIGLIVNTNL